ncbi:hypothetical protein TGRUB_208080 [Toxoplasma gondii RUB]|uniref:Uncharacterized protein n=1 Tax=Toxoplasma gondii RUB TaxID=935652 RepID=A0A086LVE5_TOXGO|nr:hypothetical protein TGRUB_208080 [Toxoplasma gondii RUB]
MRKRSAARQMVTRESIAGLCGMSIFLFSRRALLEPLLPWGCLAPRRGPRRRREHGGEGGGKRRERKEREGRAESEWGEGLEGEGQEGEGQEGEGQEGEGQEGEEEGQEGEGQEGEGQEGEDGDEVSMRLLRWVSKQGQHCSCLRLESSRLAKKKLFLIRNLSW